MDKIRITGGKPLQGTISIQGSKNSALPMMAASLLHRGVSVLKGCPAIADVYCMEDILRLSLIHILKQTISSEISAAIRSYMEDSVIEGTSRHSKVQGYSSGGKTGTAEKFPRGNKKYLVSFITFAPVEEPQVIVYVVVDEPNAEEQADSKYPQYIAQGILSELLPYLNVEPDEAEEGVVPETELWEGFDGVLEDVSGSDVEDVYKRQN